MLIAENVHFSYGQVPLLQGVSFAAEAGGITVLLGPNGCGKSTLLRCMARVLPLVQGRVMIDGRDVHQSPTKEVARLMSLLPQGPVAPEGLSVKGLVQQGRFPHQGVFAQWSSEDEAAVQNAMEAAGILEFADRHVDALSGGQRQRCWIAMVLAQQAQVMLLDEPTTFLDLKVQVDLMKLLRQTAQDQGRAIVVVLHDLNIAAAFADRLVMMKDGAIMADGPVSEVFTAERLFDVFGLKAEVIQTQTAPVCVPVIA